MSHHAEDAYERWQARALEAEALVRTLQAAAVRNDERHAEAIESVRRRAERAEERVAELESDAARLALRAGAAPSASKTSGSSEPSRAAAGAQDTTTTPARGPEEAGTIPHSKLCGTRDLDGEGSFICKREPGHEGLHGRKQRTNEVKRDTVGEVLDHVEAVIRDAEVDFSDVTTPADVVKAQLELVAHIRDQLCDVLTAESRPSEARPTCRECGGTGVVEEDGTGALGYVVNRPCPSCASRPNEAFYIEEHDNERRGPFATHDEAVDNCRYHKGERVVQRTANVTRLPTAEERKDVHTCRWGTANALDFECRGCLTALHTGGFDGLLKDRLEWAQRSVLDAAGARTDYARPTCKNHPESTHELLCRACFDDLTRFVRHRSETAARNDEQRIAELETALRSCLQTCGECGTFATWSSRETSHHAFRPTFCDSCKVRLEGKTYTDGRLVGKLVFGEWQRLKRNIELTGIYAGSAAPQTGGGRTP